MKIIHLNMIQIYSMKKNYIQKAKFRLFEILKFIIKLDILKFLNIWVFEYPPMFVAWNSLEIYYVTFV